MHGLLIAIEGSDGSGKTTQCNLLANYLRQQGNEVAIYKFPQYEKPSSYFSVQYLNGKYGDVNELGAYKPSLFYALDRFDASFAIRADSEAGKIVLCDRFVGSNMAHQGQKIADDSERKKYFDWIYNLEFNVLDIPKPDLNLVLLMPAHHAYELMGKRAKRNYTDKQRDTHEADMRHLNRAVATYRKLTDHYDKTFTAVECAEGNMLRSIDEVQAEIRSIVDRGLAQKG